MCNKSYLYRLLNIYLFFYSLKFSQNFFLSQFINYSFSLFNSNIKFYNSLLLVLIFFIYFQKLRECLHKFRLEINLINSMINKIIKNRYNQKLNVSKYY